MQTGAPEQHPAQPESREKKSNAKRIIALILTLVLLAIGGVAFYNASIGSRYLEPMHLMPSFDTSLSKGKESFEASKAAWPGDGQALAVYSWLASHVAYAEEVANLISNKASIEEVDEASSLYQGADSALVGGVSVCAGYSRAYQLLLGKLGIPCTVVAGLGDPLDPNSAHVWNLVCLGGRLGYTDATWSDMEARAVHFEGGYPGGRYSKEILVGGYAEISYFFMTDADMEYDGRVAGRTEYEQAGLNIKELLPACDTIIWEDDRYEPGYREPEGRGHFRLLPKPAEQQD